MSTVTGLATRERLLAAARELIEESGVGPLSAAEPSTEDVVGSLRTLVRRAIGAA